MNNTLTPDSSDAFISERRHAIAVCGRHAWANFRYRLKNRWYIRWECRSRTTGKIIAAGPWVRYSNYANIKRSRAQRGCDAINADRRLLGLECDAVPLRPADY